MAHEHKYKVVYFDMDGGRGEPIRLAFHYAGIPFEDDRIKHPDWPARKPHTPYHSIPYLEVDGKIIGQSGAIQRYVGKLTGLYPQDAFAAAKVDEIMDASEDIGNKLVPTMFEKDAEKKKSLREELAAGPLPTILNNINNALKANGSGPFINGEHPSVGDFKVFTIVNWLKSGTLDHIPTDLVDKYDRIVGIHKAVAALPKVDEYYAARKK
jgi:glutathione S-transferase